MKKCVGLFGTCGGSQWRNPFIEKYDQLGIEYFNPQVENWTPECAEIEAQHLKEDTIILFPVLDETYGFGSLAETGYSIIQAINNFDRFVFIYIAPKVSQKLEDENPVLAKESNRTRALVLAHLKNVKHKHVAIFDNLDEMLNASIELYSLPNR